MLRQGGSNGIFQDRVVVGHGNGQSGGALERLRRPGEESHDLGQRPEVDALHVFADRRSEVQSSLHECWVDLELRIVDAHQDELGGKAGEQNGLRKDVDECAHHREGRLSRDLMRGQPLRDVAPRFEPRTHQLVEVTRIERRRTGVRDRRWLHRDQVNLR